MALISCAECGQQVSDKATACPKCGCPINAAATSAPVLPVKNAVVDKTEQEIYSDNVVKITTARAIIANQTYSMANISSVAAVTQEPQNKGLIGMGVLGIILAAVTFTQKWWILGVVGVGMAAIGLGVGISLKPTFHLRITAAGGETNALSSKDSDYIKKIVEALNSAIVRRG